MGVHLYSNGAWTDSGRIYRNSLNLVNISDFTMTVEPASTNKLLWSGALNAGIYTFSIYQVNNYTSALRNTIQIKVGTDTYYESGTPDYHLSSGLHYYTFTVSEDATNVELRYWTNTISNECNYTNAMLNTGSTALAYEPYNVVDWYTNYGHGYSSGAWS